MGQHSSASGSVLLGLDGFEVLAAEVVGGEWRLAVQTTAELVGCALSLENRLFVMKRGVVPC